MTKPLLDITAKRQLNRGFGDAMTRAVEVAVTPLLFGLLGHLVDGWLGTRPLFTLALALFAVTGVFVRLWLGYDQEMRRLEEERARRGRSPRLRPPSVEETS